MSERTEHGFRIGAIEAVADFETPQGSSVTIRVGDAVVNIQATAKGRKAWINVKATGKTIAAASLHDGAKWVQWP